MNTVFSVIVPVYNAERYLARCIDSILRQGYKRYEIILVDDGSTDSSGRICDNYASKYPQCRVLHKANEGVASARNAGINCAIGKYIVFVDSDDYIEKELLTKAHYYMEEKQYDFFSFAARRVSEKREKLYEMRFQEGIGTYSLDLRIKFLLKTFFQYKLGWEVCFYVFKKDIIDTYGLLFNEQISYAEDMVFTFQYIQHTHRGTKVPDILYNYTENSESVTNKASECQIIKGIFGNVFTAIHSTVKSDEAYLYYAALVKYFLVDNPMVLDTAKIKSYISELDNVKLQYSQLDNILSNNDKINYYFGENGKSIIVMAGNLRNGMISKENKTKYEDISGK